MWFECIKDSARKIEVPDFKDITIHKNSNKEGLLGISDFHFGKQFDIIGNKYSEEIFYQRMEDLANKTIAICKEQGITKLHVLNTGDDIEGMTLRVSQLRSLQSGFTDQVIKLARYMAKFLNGLSKHLEVSYHHVLDGNHSELRAFGDRTFTYENAERIIITYIRDVLENNPRITIPEYTGGFSSFEVLGYNIYAQHGNKVKSPKTLIKSASAQIGKSIDVAYLGHFHSSQEMTIGVNGDTECEVINLPSIMGQDEYAQSLFLNSKASAKLDIYEEGKCRSGSFKIILN